MKISIEQEGAESLRLSWKELMPMKMAFGVGLHVAMKGLSWRPMRS
jgi:hypothetical protein